MEETRAEGITPSLMRPANEERSRPQDVTGTEEHLIRGTSRGTGGANTSQE